MHKKNESNTKKYRIVILINLILLTGLLAYWTDFVELTFNSGVRPIEFLKIIGCTLLSLIAIRIAMRFFRKRKTPTNRRIQISALITFLISSFLYFNYLNKIYVNRFLKGELRKELAIKIEPVNLLPYGTKADNLTFEQYAEITRIKWFPKLQKNADSISYSYWYEGFLPDYSFDVCYYLPKNVEVDSSEFKYGEIRIDTFGNKKRVCYSEYVD